MKHFIAACLLLLSFQIKAQGEKDWWYFGQYVGLHFPNVGSPLPQNNSSLLGSEQVSVISDPAGNLLFYTDGLKVWNRLHQIMPNGTGLMGGAIGSSTMGALIVPQPLIPHIYYIFTLVVFLFNNVG